MSVTYKDAGVDLELYDEAMARLPALMRRTHTPRVIDLAGGFAGLFRLGNSTDFPRNYRDPVLVSGTDGVGTKIKVAAAAGVYNTIGIDLVAMSVNDCLCLGAEPLFFLDYLALGRDDPALIETLVAGVAEACHQCGCALLGGETAVMPDLYRPGDFDLAGFCVGVVERSRIIDGRRIRPGDVVLGCASSGIHSNGYSLVRKIVFDRAGLKIDDPVPELQTTVGRALLEPTRLYVKPVLALLESAEASITGLAHVTGGGIAGNLERILPEDCQAQIDRGAWTPPTVFGWLQRLGQVADAEMFQVFNMGLGFLIVVRPEYAADAVARLAEMGQPAAAVGRIAHGPRRVDVI
jgi:phosphoribosylformylglycinamidine cyclo-ligase